MVAQTTEMASLSMAKLKSYLPTFASSDSLNNRHSKSKRRLDTFEPEVGFLLSLYPSQQRSDVSTDKHGHTVPELHVTIIGARHLPAIFGLKTVEGYVIKVGKLKRK